MIYLPSSFNLPIRSFKEFPRLLRLLSRQRVKTRPHKVTCHKYIYGEIIYLKLSVVAASSKSADYLLRKCSGVIPVISFILAHCEQVNPTEPIEDHTDENSELLNLGCSTSKSRRPSNFFQIYPFEACVYFSGRPF